ncbi:hypothetical protein HDV05_004789 [Chytridiales sp. JEL 0842]|nr:hypothetical protein HDV05_004789 [Chytridiales sp. JEL 0842]
MLIQVFSNRTNAASEAEKRLLVVGGDSNQTLVPIPFSPPSRPFAPQEAIRSRHSLPHEDVEVFKALMSLGRGEIGNKEFKKMIEEELVPPPVPRVLTGQGDLKKVDKLKVQANYDASMVMSAEKLEPTGALSCRNEKKDARRQGSWWKRGKKQAKMVVDSLKKFCRKVYGKSGIIKTK